VKGRIDAPDFPSSPAILGKAATDVVAAWKS
nr:Chain A, de novo designed antifreeze peptide 4m [unidentified]